MSLELRNVEKKIGQETHIYETNLKLEKNTINVLLGSTLAGKTTLMQIMAGLDKPTNGEIWFNEKNVTGVKVQKRNVSMVYQQFINYPNFNVYDNIASPLKITGVDSNEIKNRVGKVAELLKLSPMLNKRPNELSGGQRQRLALARAFYGQAKFLILDEATSALDNQTESEVIQSLEIVGRRCTTLVIAHRLSTIIKCDRIYEFSSGEIVASGNFDQLRELSPTFRNMIELQSFNQ